MRQRIRSNGVLQCGLLFLLTIAGTHVSAEESQAFVSTRVLTAATALTIAEKAEQSCSKKGYQIAVAVTDRYGNLLAFVRNPLAGPHTISVAQDKAYTAATFQSSTLQLANQLDFLAKVPRIILVGGGLPIRVGGYFYGAVGVSGAPRDKSPGDVDERCAQAGIDAVKELLEFS